MNYWVYTNLEGAFLDAHITYHVSSRDFDHLGIERGIHAVQFDVNWHGFDCEVIIKRHNTDEDESGAYVARYSYAILPPGTDITGTGYSTITFWDFSQIVSSRPDEKKCDAGEVATAIMAYGNARGGYNVVCPRCEKRKAIAARAAAEATAGAPTAASTSA